MITFVSDVHCGDELIGDCQINGLNKTVNRGHVNLAIIFSSILSAHSGLSKKPQEWHPSLPSAILAKAAETNGVKVYRTTNVWEIFERY